MGSAPRCYPASSRLLVRRIRPRRSPSRGYRQLRLILVPALFAARALLLIRQPAMGEAHQGAAVLLDGVDLDQARSRPHLLAPFPAEAVGEAMDRDHFRELAAG